MSRPSVGLYDNHPLRVLRSASELNRIAWLGETDVLHTSGKGFLWSYSRMKPEGDERIHIVTSIQIVLPRRLHESPRFGRLQCTSLDLRCAGWKLVTNRIDRIEGHNSMADCPAV
jgi:hypothetical protein